MNSPNLSDVWRNVSSRIGFFTKETCAAIPETAGIYGWFVPLWILSDDLEEFIDTVKRLFDYEPVTPLGDIEEGQRVPVSAIFSSQIVSGYLKRQGRTSISPDKLQLWDAMLTDEGARKEFEIVLMEASLLNAPLYVGKTENLKDRYFQHVNERDPERNVFHNRFQRFSRFVDCPISVSDLLFVCIRTSSDTTTVFSDSRSSDLLEHVIMNLVNPPFSMR
ncbi:MAG: hypothetical protein WD002_15655 [Pseudomonadales bacterium]